MALVDCLADTSGPCDVSMVGPRAAQFEALTWMSGSNSLDSFWNRSISSVESVFMLKCERWVEYALDSREKSWFMKAAVRAGAE